MSLNTPNAFDYFHGLNKIPVTSTGNNSTSAPASTDILNDTYSFTYGMSESLNYSSEKSISGPVFDGTLNEKETTLKVVRDDKKVYYEGVIGGKKLLLEISDNNYKGTYGDKEINLDVEYNEPSKLSKFYNQTICGRVFRPDYFNIKGTIGNKEVSINLPNADVPKDDDEKDMCSLLLFDNGCGVRTFNNKIIGIGYSNENRTNIKKHLDNRGRKIDENVKPLIMQSVSMIASVMLGALLAKIGVKH